MRESTDKTNTGFGSGFVAVCVVVWVATAVIGVLGVFASTHFEGLQGTHGENMNEGISKLAIAALASLLLGILYFLSGWTRDVLKSPGAKNMMLSYWLSFVCSIIVCLIGVLAFGVQSCVKAMYFLDKSVTGLLALLVPIIYVFFIGLLHVITLVGLIRWYARYLRARSMSPAEMIQDSTFRKCGLLPWQQYFDFAILVFVGMGITALIWMISSDEAKIAGALGHILSLLFGLLGVGIYASGTDSYLAQIRALHDGEQKDR